MPDRDALPSNDLDIVEIARRKVGVFGSDARPILLARAENFRRHGHHRTAKFWQAVADKVEAISESLVTE